jgi:hypothetical protein
VLEHLFRIFVQKCTIVDVDAVFLWQEKDDRESLRSSKKEAVIDVANYLKSLQS